VAAFDRLADVTAAATERQRVLAELLADGPPDECDGTDR
jgi:hypothetical protein